MASTRIVLKLSRGARRRLKLLSKKTTEKIVFRRCQIILKLAQGEAAKQIAAELACNISTVYRTRKIFETQGEIGLMPKPRPGRPSQFTLQLKKRLAQIIAQDPRTLGENFSNWTTKCLGHYLKLDVHPTTVLRHIWALGWRWRRPALRVASPDPRYKAKVRYLPRLHRSAQRGEIHLYYADEMAVALLPTISGCWMQIGHQTKVNTPGKNAKQYAFGAVNAITGELQWLMWENKNNVGFRRLLNLLLDHHQNSSEKIVLVLDNYRIHKAQAVKAMLRKYRQLIRLYFLPTYSPQLNPIERVWRYFRQKVTDNTFFKTMRRLLFATAEFLSALAAQHDIILSIISA